MNDALDQMNKNIQERYDKGQILLDNIKTNLVELEKFHNDIEFTKEDLIYRFYHTSFKVYWLQEDTLRLLDLFVKVSPHKSDKTEDIFDPLFLDIIDNGSGKSWELKHNKEWGKHTRPIVEAFLHSMYFLEMMIKYGKELNEAPSLLPSGWAALLELYRIR